MTTSKFCYRIRPVPEHPVIRAPVTPTRGIRITAASHAIQVVRCFNCIRHVSHHALAPVSVPCPCEHLAHMPASDGTSSAHDRMQLSWGINERHTASLASAGALPCSAAPWLTRVRLTADLTSKPWPRCFMPTSCFVMIASITQAVSSHAHRYAGSSGGDTSTAERGKHPGCAAERVCGGASR